MKMRVPLVPVARLALYCVLELVVALAVMAGLLWALPYLKQSRNTLQSRTQQLTAAPDSSSQQSALASRLAVHAHDIARIQAHVPATDTIPAVIEVLEQTAASRGVEIRIPDIGVVERSDHAEEDDATPDNPYQDIRFALEATGSPETLLRFVHDVEYLPYVLATVTWELTAVPPVGGPTLGIPAPAGENVSVAAPAGRLDAEYILKVVSAP